MANPAGQPECALTNAFDGVAPSASAASSSAIKHLPYDVFINHRGPDVKYTLASSLYHSLNVTGLRVFLDMEELELGDFLPKAIQEAMRTASVQIAIFSQNYAQSPWCLAELAFMLETGTTIIPLFYHVQPSDLRWAVQAKGRYADALAEYEKKGRYTSQLQQWKAALQQASFYSGDIINNGEDEQRVRKNVVNRVLKLMKKVPLEVAKHPVGLNEAVQEFEMTASQCGQSHESVQIVGIWGMGGSGKTTLAKELYNRKCSAMEGSSFLFDLRDAAGKGLLIQKQKKLLEDLGLKSDSTFDHIDEGKGIIASRLRSVSALIILDDVDHPDQLDALLPHKDSLGRGSFIIVTTRELDVLTSWGISAVHKMRALNPFHAEQLFCWHSFLQPSPVSGFEDLVQKFVIACQSLPLSLKVLGGQLYGKSGKDYWVSQFDKISRILPADIENKLKLSYDALDKEEKEMFLDTSCFFIGKKDSLAIAVWDGSGWSGLVGWEKLVNKCLVELDEDNCIRMHDHLRDLGRVIANQKSPYRLFSPEQIIDTQLQQKRIQIRGVVNATDEFPRWSPQGKIKVKTSEGFLSLKPSIHGLKILVGYGDFLNQKVNQLLEELVLFDGSFLNQRNLPWPSLENLRILKVANTVELEELWEADADAPLHLIELVIDHCKMFKGFPRSIGSLKYLKYLKVDTNSMKSLPEEFCLLQSLEHLQLKNCGKLSSLPSRFGYLTNLRHLDLSECSELSMLPVTFKQLTLLQYFRLEDCSKLNIKSDILENITKLEYLNFSNHWRLEELPRHIADQTSMRELYLDGTSIRELPANIDQLSKLEILKVGSQLLTSLPSSFGNLRSLSKLEIYVCNELEYLPESLGDLSSLTKFEITDCTKLKSLPESLGNLSSLTQLEITDCAKLKSLPESLGNLSSLRKLEITSCAEFESLGESFGKLSSLTKFAIRFCAELKSLPESLGSLDLLEHITIISIEVKSLPESFTRLINLQTLSIYSNPISELSLGSGCKLKRINVNSTKVSKISISEDCCPCLKALELISNDHLMEVETLPTTVETIEVKDCRMLKNIRGIRGLANLQTLKIKECSELDALPSFAELTSLREFELKGCHKVEKIEGTEHLKSVEKFEAYSCLKVPCIVSLEITDRLKELVLVANERSVIESFIDTIQKWPSKMIICTRAVCDVGSVLDSFEFPNLSVLSFPAAEIPISYEEALKYRKENLESSTNGIMMICFIINCVCADTELAVGRGKYSSESYGRLGKGKWVWTGVFPQLFIEQEYRLYERGVLNDVPRNKVEAAWFVTGEKDRLVETFHHILDTFTSVTKKKQHIQSYTRKRKHC